MKIVLAGVLALFIGFIPVSYAEKASSESIRVLMNKTGSGELGVIVMNQMLPALKRMVPEAPEEFWQDFMAEVSPDELVNMVIPVYQKHLSQADVDAINEFYDTEAGRKLIKSMPAIAQESMAVGQKWGQDIAEKVIGRYKAQTQTQK